MKIAIVGNDDFTMLHFMSGLIRYLLGRGLEVVVIVPSGIYVDKLEQLGARCITIPIKRFISPFSDLRLLVSLYEIFVKEDFDLVHNNTIKPNTIGTLAARMAGVKHIVCLICGLGFAFAQSFRWRDRLLMYMTTKLYQFSLTAARKVWFQNPDDLKLFVKMGVVPLDKGVVILGNGINLNEYSPGSVNIEKLAAIRSEFHLPIEAKIVLMVAARRVWSKGVAEFVEAAKILETSFPEWYFVMLCPEDPGSPDAVPKEYIQLNKPRSMVVVDGWRDDVKAFIALSDVMVLPSYYPEGLPRCLLEGMAMSKPIVTTDHPGCREVVQEGVNGYLVPIKNSSALSERLRNLMINSDKRQSFSRESRRMAETLFAEEIVISQVVEKLYGLPFDPTFFQDRIQNSHYEQ